MIDSFKAGPLRVGMSNPQPVAKAIVADGPLTHRIGQAMNQEKIDRSPTPALHHNQQVDESNETRASITQ